MRPRLVFHDKGPSDQTRSPPSNCIRTIPCAAGSSCVARIAAVEPERLGVLRAHPAPAGGHTRRSKVAHARKNGVAGLDVLTAVERAQFSTWSTAHVERFGFPFIIAVHDHDKAGIMAAFEARLAFDVDTAFAMAFIV